MPPPHGTLLMMSATASSCVIGQALLRVETCCQQLWSPWWARCRLTVEMADF